MRNFSNHLIPRVDLIWIPFDAIPAPNLKNLDYPLNFFAAADT